MLFPDEPEIELDPEITQVFTARELYPLLRMCEDDRDAAAVSLVEAAVNLAKRLGLACDIRTVQDSDGRWVIQRITIEPRT